MRFSPFSLSSRFLSASALCLFLGLNPAIAPAQDTAFRQAVAEAASSSDGVAAHYRNSRYKALWTEDSRAGRDRRAALIAALQNATLHGLPDMAAKADVLLDQMRNVRSTRDLGLVEVALSKAFVEYARDLQSGLLVPKSIDDGIQRNAPLRAKDGYLDGLSSTPAAAYFQELAPTHWEYRALMKEKLRLETILADGGWGRSVPVRKMEFGDSGDNVVALRDRLVRMGYMRPSPVRSFDESLRRAVQSFQVDHGLEPDGVAGEGTIGEINVPVTGRLKSVIVAMERERWMNLERGERHILVNQTDFTAKVVDAGHVTFVTRSVIGKNTGDRRSPEFSDEMEHMIINPSWHVPRSIITKEYLPQLQANPNAVSYLEITDARGRVVNRGAVDFTQFTARSFPFAMRQPPSTRNALGLVKFIFPNKHNIYLHDTPEKHLFSREVRAYSHGCIRLAQPFDFAYTILAKQVDSPKSYFHRLLDSGKETKVDLDEHIPVHIIYRTAFTEPGGKTQFRRDIYKRDAKIWAALEEAGVTLPTVQG
ncbi:MAG: L,D-transpeptidase family protein [Paracoccaceae bacterium]